MNLDLDLNPTTPEMPEGWAIDRFAVVPSTLNTTYGKHLVHMAIVLERALTECLELHVHVSRPDGSQNHATWDEHKSMWHWYKPWTDYEAA